MCPTSHGTSVFRLQWSTWWMIRSRDDVGEMLEIDNVAGAGIQFSGHGDLEHVVVAVNMTQLPNSPPILLGERAGLQS